MKIPQLQIQITNAQIGLTIPDPQQHIEQPPADLQIEQPAADLSIHTTEGQFQFDYTQFWNDLGFYSLTDVARNFAQKGIQAGLEGIARRAREGRQLGDIAHGNNAIAAISKSKNTNIQQKQLGIAFIPSYQAIKAHYTPADVQIDVQKNDPKIEARINKPIYDYTPGKVSLDLLQQPSVKIDWLV